MDFKDMTVNDLVSYVNSKLEIGLSLIKIAEELGVNESSIRKKLTKQGYKRVGKSFVLQERGQHVVHKNKSSNEVDKTSDDTEVIRDVGIDVVKKEDNILPIVYKEKFIRLMDEYEVLIKIIEQYKSTNVVQTGDIVVQLPNEDNKSYKTSLRINKVVLDQFKEFCEKHKEFSQKDLLSMALVEYMRNHG